MKDKKFYSLDDNLLSEIICSAYGDAPVSKRIKIFLLRKFIPAVEITYNKHRKIALEIKNIKEEKCPDQIVKSVFSQTGIKSGTKHYFWEDVYSIYLLKPVFSFTIVLLITAGLIFSVLRNPEKVKYTTAEIELADKQARETLLLVSAIFNKTSSTLTNDILPEQVAKRINKGVNVIEDLFKENKNETIN